MKKVDAFSNSPFKNPADYISFVKDNDVAGLEAITLKKKMDKRVDIGEPKILEVKG